MTEVSFGSRVAKVEWVSFHFFLEVSPSVSLDEARDILIREDFSEHVKKPSHVIMKRSGTQLAVSGEKFPIELVIAEAESGLILQLRYDGFVLFDTGDLGQLADSLASKLQRS